MISSRLLRIIKNTLKQTINAFVSAVTNLLKRLWFVQNSPRPGVFQRLLVTLWIPSEWLLLAFIPLSLASNVILPAGKITESEWICECMDGLCMYDTQQTETSGRRREKDQREAKREMVETKKRIERKAEAERLSRRWNDRCHHVCVSVRVCVHVCGCVCDT